MSRGEESSLWVGARLGVLKPNNAAALATERRPKDSSYWADVKYSLHLTPDAPMTQSTPIYI